MRVLVTGAAGFIGSHLTDRLLSDGHDVFGVDDLSSGSRSNLTTALRFAEGRPGAFSFQQADVADVGLPRLAEEFRPEVVCHLAAQISVRESVGDPLRDARVNVLGTLNVLEAARRTGARKVVYTSSCAVYGVPKALPLTDASPRDPISPYAASKISGEVYAQMYANLHGLRSTTLTLANVYGPRQSPAGEAGVISLFTSALLRGEPTRVYGDGAQTRDYVFVEDVVDAFVRACGDVAPNARLNIGTGVQTTDRDLHTVVAEAAGAPDDPAFAPPRPGDVPASVVDPEPARLALGWAPRTALRDGIKSTVEWMRHGFS
ncbi:MAG: NAD-dependent epimerase/dehydratase family protein [Streptosporangiales bacterium]|nr:NAD-dependent epimerase/dehydratase family protein [Streptosporangiales bacterium]